MTTLEEALEGSTPLAQKVRAAGPYRSGAQLIAQMRAMLPTLTDEEKVATLNAHPRIGDDPQRLSTRSLKEQGAGQHPELARLNDEYERRFGFRFVVFVNRRPKAEILGVLKSRMANPTDQELETALSELVSIAEDRWSSA